MNFFQFQNPEYLLLLLLLPILGWLAGRTGPEASIRFSSISLAKRVSHARHSRPGRFLFGLRLLALAALIVALARPQMGKMNNATDAEGIDIVITLDLSNSMAALDLSTRKEILTRLDAAKKVVSNFIGKRTYDRIGLVAFAADAYVVSPLTLNHDWLKKNLDRLELGEIDGGGTAIGTALGASVNRLRGHEARSQIVILLTDGENNSGSLSPVAAADAAKSYGVKIYTIATGKQGRVPMAEMTQDGRIIRDQNGNPVYRRGNNAISDYDETELKEITEITGGLFFKATENGDLEGIYDEIDALETTKFELRSYATFTEYFVWPALIGLLLLGLEQLLSNTRYRRLP